MKLFFRLTLLVVAAAFIMQSCSEDEVPAAPSVTLDATELMAKAGEEITIVATITAPGGFSKISVQKFWGDTAEGAPEESTTLINNTYNFTYTVTEDDVEPILKFRFTATDNNSKTSAPVETVVDVELNMAQILVKYDWLHTEAVREKTGEEEISDHDADNVFRYEADGTYQMSYGTVFSDFEGLNQYCYWTVNEETGRLIRSVSSFNGATWEFTVDRRDTLDITNLTELVMEANTILRGLDQLDPLYDPVENYKYKYAAQAKSASFDPYKPGADDDAGPANGVCVDVDFH